MFSLNSSEIFHLAAKPVYVVHLNSLVKILMAIGPP